MNSSSVGSWLCLNGAIQPTALVRAQIGQRLQEMERLSQLSAYPAGRVGASLNIETTRHCLTNRPARWQTENVSFKNDLLRIFVQRILITPGNKQIRARIVWANGCEHEILITRPQTVSMGENRWSESELALLKSNYATATWEELLQMLPKRGLHAITEHAGRLHLKRAAKPYGKRAPWTPAEDELIRQVVAGGLALGEAVKRLERTPNAIYVRANQLGVGSRKFETFQGQMRWQVVDAGGGADTQSA
jgi:hypothetical protein